MIPKPANENQRMQPRGLRRTSAAAYLGISPSHFDKQRAAGAIPAPRQILGVVLWDRRELDSIFDGDTRPAANDNANPWDDAIAPPKTETSARVH
jgi:hypothetical protein